MTTATQTLGRFHRLIEAVLARFTRTEAAEQSQEQDASSYFDAPTSAEVMTRLHIKAHYGG